MSKVAIVYASTHHGNTKKLVEAIAKENEVELIDATKCHEKNMNSYDVIGFASGIYYSKFHHAVLNFANVNLPQNKSVFFICTYGGHAVYSSIENAIEKKNTTVLGTFGCKGYDTYGPFKLVGGLCKGHPDQNDIDDVIRFYEGLEL